MCRWRSALNYLAGLVYEDGTLYYYKRNNEYFTYVYDNNREFLEEVGKLIARALKVKYTIVEPSRTKRYYRLQFTSKRVYEYVKDLVKIRPLKPTKNFIRGFLDAEGTLTLDRKGRITLEIANKNKEMVDSIAKWLRKRDVRCTVTKHKNKNGVIYKVRIRGWENVKRTIKLLNLLHPKIKDKFIKYSMGESLPRSPP